MSMDTTIGMLIREAKRIVDSAKASGLIKQTTCGTARAAESAERSARYERLRTIRRARRDAVSKKMLGGKAYYFARKQQFQRIGLNAHGKPYKRMWTGLSDIDLGHAEYMRQWRALRRERAAKGAV